MRWAIASLFLLLCCATLDAAAIIGRPLTPMSYAGVARRTTRRAVYGGAAMYGAAAVGAATAATAATMAALPSSCAKVAATGAIYYQCGGTYYQPAYDGPDVVYVQVEKP